MNSPQQFAVSLYEFLDEACLKTDAGVHAVFIYLAANPRQSFRDVASNLGFTEDQVKRYLDALGHLVESYYDFYELSPAGDAVFERAIAGDPASATSVLSPKELARWEFIKTLIMDTSEYGGKTIKEKFALYYSHASGSKLDEDELIDLSCVFKNQGFHGLSIHPPGTRPAYFFKSLMSFHHTKLKKTDEKLIVKALDAGLTFW